MQALSVPRSSMQPTYRNVTVWRTRDIVSTRVVRCWVGMKRESFVWEGIQRCRSSQTRTLTTCFNGSELLTTWYTTDLSGWMLSLKISTTLAVGTGSTEESQVLVTVVRVVGFAISQNVLGLHPLNCAFGNSFFCVILGFSVTYKLTC